MSEKEIVTSMSSSRKKNGLTQAELAARIGVDRITIARYEAGTRSPSPGVAERIAEVLGWSLETMWALLYRNSSYHKFN